MAAAEAVAQQGWSSLPADLVNRVADCILATNDLDYYMDLRAVCQGWRSSTADPKASRDVRFHPTRWIVLDELASESDTRLFVNAATGRFLRRSLPLLRDFHFVSSTTGGFLVLAEREPPHAARVLNPFTGSLIRFRAPVPNQMHMHADVIGSSPTLVLADDDGTSYFTIFHADPESERFCEEEVRPFPLLPRSESDASKVALGPIALSFLVRRVAVELASGEILRVHRSPLQEVQLFKFRFRSGEEKERVYNIGDLALFVGKRCISIHADSFPSIKANCIYYKKKEQDENCIFGSDTNYTYMYDLALDKEERITESDICLYPASIHQLLVEYTMCAPRYEPRWEEDQRFNQRVDQLFLECFFTEEWQMEMRQMDDFLQQLDDDDGGLYEDDWYYPFVQ
jgi:hypothetical protein